MSFMKRSDKEISLIQWVAKSYPNQNVVRLRFNLKEMQLDLVTSFYQEKKQKSFLPILQHLPSLNSAHLHTNAIQFWKIVSVINAQQCKPIARISQMNPSKWLSIIIPGSHNIHCMILLTMHLTWLVQQVPVNTPIYVYGLHTIWPWNVHSRLILLTQNYQVWNQSLTSTNASTSDKTANDRGSNPPRSLSFHQFFFPPSSARAAFLSAMSTATTFWHAAYSWTMLIAVLTSATGAQRIHTAVKTPKESGPRGTAKHHHTKVHTTITVYLSTCAKEPIFIHI